MADLEWRIWKSRRAWWNGPAKKSWNYRIEADQQKDKIEKMKAEGKDEHDVKKMNECMQESLWWSPSVNKPTGEGLRRAQGSARERASGSERIWRIPREAEKVLEADEQLKASD